MIFHCYFIKWNQEGDKICLPLLEVCNLSMPKEIVCLNTLFESNYTI
jgi:hypothetical protein